MNTLLNICRYIYSFRNIFNRSRCLSVEFVKWNSTTSLTLFSQTIQWIFADNSHQQLSTVINSHQQSSTVIKSHQQLSTVIVTAINDQLFTRGRKVRSEEKVPSLTKPRPYSLLLPLVTNYSLPKSSGGVSFGRKKSALTIRVHIHRSNLSKYEYSLVKCDHRSWPNIL